MEGLRDAVAAVAEEGGFSGAVSVSDGSELLMEAAFGLADRAHRVPCEPSTLFAIASGTKGFTALAIMSLVADGILAVSTTARSLLGSDLPLIHDEVTVEQLLAHRSGIGDYVDEDDEQPLRVPVQELDSVAAYLPALDGDPAKFAPGERFGYCNSGFAVLAILAERAAGASFDDLLAARVFGPAGMADTGFLRSDALPGRAAIGYLEDGRTNVFALPVHGSGDGGAYSTLADLRAFWAALYAGRIVSADVVAEMTRPRSDVPKEKRRYGLGFWLHATGPAVLLEGYDHGVSFRSVHDPDTALTYTVMSNTAPGAWPIARLLEGKLVPR
jgi:CubicO group peptidase (beta-lactamase class C family)